MMSLSPLGRHPNITGFLLWACCLVGAPVKAQAPSLTRDEVVAGLAKQAQLFTGQQNWMVHYKNVRENVEPVPGAELHWPPMELTNARTRDGWMYTHTIQDDLGGRFKVNHWISWKDKVCVDRTHNSVMILPEPSVSFFSLFCYPASLWVDVFSDITLHSPDVIKSVGYTRPSECFKDAFTNCVVRDPSHYKLRPNLERVDDGMCYVLEAPGWETIWIDPALGFVARKRVRGNSRGKVGWETRNEQFKDCGGGLWLPQKQETWVYNPTNVDPKYLDKVAYHEVNTVIEIRVNDVPESLFDVPIPDEANVDDYIRGVQYQRPAKSGDPLETAVEQVQAHPVQNAGTWMKAGVLGLIVIGLGLLCFFLWLGKRRGAPPVPGSPQPG